ncbi:MAG TPA: hypothetical protein VGB97_03175 [Candidatus Paceibacterota bacterium]|jgi:hypothetical protein
MAASSELLRPLFTPLEPAMERAYRDLQDPEKSIRVELETGQGAGKLDVIYSLFPPDQTEPLALYSFKKSIACIIHVPLRVRRFERGSELGSGSEVLGLYDQQLLWKRGIRCPLEKCWVVVRYNLRRREGHLYLSKELHEQLIAI